MELVVGVALAASLAAVGTLHVVGGGILDPARRVISDYVVVPGGYVLLAVAASGYAVACVALAAALGPAGLPRPELPSVLLLGGAAGLLVTAVFPTNVPGTPVGFVANVHRAGGAVAFVMLPMAGWFVARRAAASERWRAGGVLRWSEVAIVVSATYLLFQVPIVVGIVHEFTFIGGAERVLCATVLVVLFSTARAARAAMGTATCSAPAGTAFAPEPLSAPEPLGGAA